MEAPPKAALSHGELLVELQGISKQFPEVLAVDHVDFQLRRGEIHALLGENGAGKTTLMNVLYGIVRPTSGTVLVRGKAASIHSPRDSIKLGIGMVHQHLKVVEPHTVVENIILGLKEPRYILNLKDAAQRVKGLAEKYGLPVDPNSRIWQLSIGERQRVEILKVLYRDADILIMDEPTSVLTPQETKELFSSLVKMKEEGKGIVFITHKMREVFELSDRVTVMRRGRVVSVAQTHETDERELARSMVGREVIFSLKKASPHFGEDILKLEGVVSQNDKGLLALRSVSLTVCGGEIMGVAGVAGNGQKELTEVIAGLRHVTAGRVSVGGEDTTNSSPKAAFERGVAFIPEERMGVGAVPSLSVAENLALKSYRYPPSSNRGFLDEKVLREKAIELIAKYDIMTPSPETPARFLSGGNLQKVVLARELSGGKSTGPKVIIASYPTRGLDVGAAEYIQKALLAFREQGIAILIVSEELDELFMLSDRLAVMFNGRIMGVLDQGQFDVEAVGLMMAGKEREGVAGSP
jgi:simple sugar transport system ATP-binding protein